MEMIELGRALPSAGPRTGVADAHRDRQSADYSKPPQALPSSPTVSPHGWGSGRQGRRRCIPVPGSIDSAGGVQGEGKDLGVGCYDCGLLHRKDGNHPAQALSREQQIQRRRVGDFPGKQGVLQGCRRHERKCIERGVEFISHLPGVCWEIESSPVLQICFNEI